MITRSVRLLLRDAPFVHAQNASTGERVDHRLAVFHKDELAKELSGLARLSVRRGFDRESDFLVLLGDLALLSRYTLWQTLQDQLRLALERNLLVELSGSSCRFHPDR